MENSAENVRYLVCVFAVCLAGFSVGAFIEYAITEKLYKKTLRAFKKGK